MKKCNVCKVMNEYGACAFEHNGDENICQFDDEYLDLSGHDDAIKMGVLSNIGYKLYQVCGGRSNESICLECPFSKYKDDEFDSCEIENVLKENEKDEFLANNS